LAGGCNPIHIDYRVEGDSLRITAAALADAASTFIEQGIFTEHA